MCVLLKQCWSIQESGHILTLSTVGPLHEYMGIWPRTQWSTGEYAQFSSNGLETPYACINALLHRQVFLVKHALKRSLTAFHDTEVEQTGASSQFYDKFSKC